MTPIFSNSAFALTNSQPAIGDSSNFNVWLQIEGVYKGESFTGYCNGSLIADDLIVTAAHCLSGSTKQPTEITARIGKYKTTTGKFGAQTLFHLGLDIIKSKRIFFPKAIDQKVRAGNFSGPGDINPNYDVAMIELERPIDRSKVNVQLIPFVTTKEYEHVAANSQNYTFIALSTNPTSEMQSSQTRRYASMSRMEFNGIINKIYNYPMINPVSPNSTEEGDSGAPILVNISGEWKLLAVVKGVKNDFLSSKLTELAKKKISITPTLNMYSPIANHMCDLLSQADRPCN